MVASPSASRFARMHAFEILIFIIMTILLAMCLVVAPVVAEPPTECVPAAARG